MSSLLGFTMTHIHRKSHQFLTSSFSFFFLRTDTDIQADTCPDGRR